MDKNNIPRSPRHRAQTAPNHPHFAPKPIPPPPKTPSRLHPTPSRPNASSPLNRLPRQIQIPHHSPGKLQSPTIRASRAAYTPPTDNSSNSTISPAPAHPPGNHSTSLPSPSSASTPHPPSAHPVTAISLTRAPSCPRQRHPLHRTRVNRASIQARYSPPSRSREHFTPANTTARTTDPTTAISVSELPLTSHCTNFPSVTSTRGKLARRQNIVRQLPTRQRHPPHFRQTQHHSPAVLAPPSPVVGTLHLAQRHTIPPLIPMHRIHQLPAPHRSPSAPPSRPHLRHLVDKVL